MVVEPPPEDLVERVLARLPAEPRRTRSPGRSLLARRRRLVAVIIAVVIIGLGLTPPVRAAVVEWLRIGGVLIKTAPARVRSRPDGRAVPTQGAVVTLEQAQALVTFPIGVPADLARPTGSRSRPTAGWSRWTGPPAHPVHLDQFDGSLYWIFVKSPAARSTYVAVNGRDAVWFPTPHEVIYVDRDGNDRTAQARIAGPCLVWERPPSAEPVTRAAGG